MRCKAVTSLDLARLDITSSRGDAATYPASYAGKVNKIIYVYIYRFTYIRERERERERALILGVGLAERL